MPASSLDPAILDRARTVVDRAGGSWEVDRGHYARMVESVAMALRAANELTSDLQNDVRDTLIACLRDDGVAFDDSRIDGAGSDAGEIEYTRAEINIACGFYGDALRERAAEKDQRDRELTAFRESFLRDASTLTPNDVLERFDRMVTL